MPLGDIAGAVHSINSGIVGTCVSVANCLLELDRRGRLSAEGENFLIFLPENSLEWSLKRAAEDPAHRPQFYRDLVESDLFIVQHGPPPEKSGWVPSQEAREIEIQTVEFDGKPYIPLFSSLTRLQAALQEDAGYMALNAMELMKMTSGADLLLNPGSDFGREFTKEEIQSIIDGSIWETESLQVEKDAQVLLGQPANYPHDLANALSGLFTRTKQVKQAYLAQFFIPEKHEKPHILVGIEVSENWDEVISQASLVAEQIDTLDTPVEFIQIAGQGGLEDYFLEECKPFYKKKVF